MANERDESGRGSSQGRTVRRSSNWFRKTAGLKSGATVGRSADGSSAWSMKAMPDLATFNPDVTPRRAPKSKPASDFPGVKKKK